MNTKHALLLLLASAAISEASVPPMQTAQLGWNPSGVYIVNGEEAPFDASWTNSTGQTVYIWGAQADLWFNGMVCAAQGVEDYLRNIADLGVQVTIDHGTLILKRGMDHYDNAPDANDRPVFFPRPFVLPPGHYVFMHAHGHNGFQPYYGGTLVFNADVILYYTIGTP